MSAQKIRAHARLYRMVFGRKRLADSIRKAVFGYESIHDTAVDYESIQKAASGYKSIHDTAVDYESIHDTTVNSESMKKPQLR